LARKPYLLRLDPVVHEALQKWADDELRSVNGQIEYLLREALKPRAALTEEEAGSEEGGERFTPGIGAPATACRLVQAPGSEGGPDRFQTL